MRMRMLAPALAALAIGVGGPRPVAVLASPDAPASPARATEYALRRLDVNRLALRVTNDGRFPYDPLVLPAFAPAPGGATTTDRSGLAYPRGANATTMLYAAGLWVGGTLGGDVRVALGEYASDFLPGSKYIGAPMPLGDPRMTVYKVARWTGNPADSAHVTRTTAELAADPSLDPLAHHSWSEYMAWAAPYGAPWRHYRLPLTGTPAPDDSVDVPGPLVTGDQMLWSVYRDADEYEPRGNPGTGSLPLEIEVRQSVFAYDRPGPLGATAFVRYEILKRGAGSLPDLRVGLWSDPDIGQNLGDDLTGCDTTRSLAFAYNTLWGQDPAFGSAKPAVGFTLLSARSTAAPASGRPLAAFAEYVNGADPRLAAEYWNLLRGLRQDGTPMTAPGAPGPTTFQYPGEPVSGQGWVDDLPGNVKTIASSGPLPLGAGDTVVVWFALPVGQGPTPVGSLLSLRCAADDVRDVFAAGFAEPFAAPRACEPPATPCPRGADWWVAECASHEAFTPGQLESIAHWADSVSANLVPTAPPRSGPFCASMAWEGSARDSVLHELLAFFANAAAADLGIAPSGGAPIGLPLETGVRATPLTGGTVAGMLRFEDLRRGLVGAQYENDVPSHRRALDGIGSSLPFFTGGAGTGAAGGGSSIDPHAMPDSFPTVLLRFDRAAGQQAYRYLRLETALGEEPAGGRAWLYGGHRFVPLTAWDLRSGRQLELAFSERAVTGNDGTLLPAWAQPASFDSAWAPNSSADGGLERLWVLSRPYSATPRAAFATDGAPLAGTWPALYQLDARLRGTLDVVDDGDGFRFVAGWPRTSSADALVFALASSTPADTEATRLYRELTASLRDVNLGFGVGPVCVRAAPFEVTLIEATVTDLHVQLRWRLGEAAASARLERRNANGIWLDAGAATLEPAGTALAQTDEIDAGRYAYRLIAAGAVGIARSDSVWIETPSSPTPALAVTGVWPNPAGAASRVSFTLPSGGTAKLEVYDLGGRRAYERDLGSLAAGLHHVEIAPGRRFRPGVYFVTLRFGGERRTARFVAL